MFIVWFTSEVPLQHVGLAAKYYQQPSIAQRLLHLTMIKCEVQYEPGRAQHSSACHAIKCKKPTERF
jgi:hypothetical protein